MLKNLLANAFKFTEQGEVARAQSSRADHRLEPGDETLAKRARR